MKKIILLLAMMMFTMSVIHMSANADVPGTYLDGETLRIDNFALIGEDLIQKIVEEKDGKIYSEEYIYDNCYSGDANNYNSFDLYLEANGWKDTTKRNSSIYGGPVTHYTATFSKDDYRIQMDNDIYGESFSIRFYISSAPDDTVKTTYEGYKFRACGYGLWHTVEDGVLTISGYKGTYRLENENSVSTVNLSGRLYNYITESKTPWYGEKVTKIVLEKDVAGIGMGFGALPEVTTIEIKGKLDKLPYLAFAGCGNLKEIYYIGTQEEWKIIAEDIKLPENVIIYCGDGTKIGKTEKEKENELLLKQLRMTIGSKTAKLYGKDLSMDVAPQIINGRTMLPARYVTENLGGGIEWIAEHRIVAITRDSSVLVFQIDSDSAILLTFLDDSEENYDFNLDMTDELNSIVGGYEGNDDIYNGNIGFDYIDYKALIGEYDEETEYTVSEIKLDSAPILVSGRTFMPVRVIATFLGADVMWDGETQTIMIEPKN